MSNSGTPPLSLAENKRGACDRCRGQKLRCRREDTKQNPPQGTCVRCFKAGAICSFGVAKRAGRTPVFNTSFPQGRKRDRGGKPQIGAAASRPTVSASGRAGFPYSEAGAYHDQRGTGDRGGSRVFEEYIADQESEREAEDTTLVHTMNLPSLHETSNVFGGVSTGFLSTATLPWFDETVPSSSTNDAEEDSSLESSNSKYSWAFHNHRVQQMDIQGSTILLDNDGGQFRNMDVNAYGLHANTQKSGAPDETMDLDLLLTGANEALFNPTNALDSQPLQLGDQDREWARLAASSGISSTNDSEFYKDLTDAEITLGQKTLSIHEIQHQRIQELSILAADLYAQLTTNDPEDHRPRSDTTATSFQDQLVGSVLKSSNTFLTLLSSFSRPATSSSSSPPPPPPPPYPPTSSSHPTRDCSESDTSPSASALDIDVHATGERVQHSLGKFPASSSENMKPPPQIDTATVLQVLTCHIRIIHLHGIMHARILDYLFPFLQSNAQHVSPVPPVFPDMQVGGVSLDRFGMFQVKLLLQISVHVLGEIESTLGLPKEFRVGKSEGGRIGVLGASVSGDFVRCLMSEGAWRGRKVESVKEQLGNLRGVLKSVINF